MDGCFAFPFCLRIKSCQLSRFDYGLVRDLATARISYDYMRAWVVSRVQPHVLRFGDAKRDLIIFAVVAPYHYLKPVSGLEPAPAALSSPLPVRFRRLALGPRLCPFAEQFARFVAYSFDLIERRFLPKRAQQLL